MPQVILKRRLQLAICLFVLVAVHPGLCQNQTGMAPKLCNGERALEILRQQLDSTKTFDSPVQRIAVLMRGSDLLWSDDPARAREGFAEAFDLALQYYKEKGNAPRREGKLRVQDSDQRYLVVRGIARRDAKWARKLLNRLLDDEREKAHETATDDPSRLGREAENLLALAQSLVSSDPGSAVDFAKYSLRYPATLNLPTFLYKLSEANSQASNQFYQLALAAYANAPMDEFLYLSSYPFGNNREVGEMPSFYYYQVPVTFVPKPALQSLFVRALLTRAQQAIDSPGQATVEQRLSEPAQIYIALTRLEPQIQKLQPDLLPDLGNAKRNLSSLLSQKDLQRLDQVMSDPPKQSFDDLIADAERQRDPNKREALLVSAVLGASVSIDLERLVDAAGKIDDLALREQVLNRIYFERASQAIKMKDPDARKFASMVKELDERAYLYSKITEAEINQSKNPNTHELLDEVLTAAMKSPDTEVKVRTLLTVAYLYTKVEPNRSVTVLSEAVNSINRIESPDFSRDYVIKRIEGKSFGNYVTLQTPGFDPQNGFREIGKYDFEGALYQASNIGGKSLRALTTLALVDLCLEETQQRIKSNKTKKDVAIK